MKDCAILLRLKRFARLLSAQLDCCCRVTPYSGENLSLLPHTSETRSLPRVATKQKLGKKCSDFDEIFRTLFFRRTDFSLHGA